MKIKVAILGVILTTGLLSGCESSQHMFKKQNELAQADEPVLSIHCEMMYRTGSNKKTKVCRTAEQMEQDKKGAERSLERLQKNGPLVTSSN